MTERLSILYIVFFKSFILFIFGCAVFDAEQRLSLVAASRDYSLLVVQRLLIVVASVVVAHSLECRLNS